MILVLSDIHVGRKGAHWQEALRLMSNPKWDQIVICGDFFDLWYKPNVILTLILLFLDRELAKKIVYVVGNHDEDMDDLLPFGTLFNLVTNRYMLVIGDLRYTFVHGHETDFFNSKAAWIGHLLTKCQALIHKIFRLDTHALASSVTEKLRLRRQRQNLIEKYKDRTDILVSGHTHIPGRWIFRNSDDEVCHHYNVGDWVRSRTFLVIDKKGIPSLQQLETVQPDGEYRSTRAKC